MTAPRRAPARRTGRRVPGGQLAMAAALDWPTEADYQRHVIRTAKANGWAVFHVPRMKGKTGDWMTNTLLPGWPDLVMIRPPTLLFIELKGPKGRPSPEQSVLIGKLRKINRVVAAFCWPGDWPKLERMLTAPDETAPE